MRRILLLQALRNLRQPGVARDQGRRAGGRGLGGDHPECLREDRWDDRGIRERQQVHQVPVLERAGEERVRACELLELLAEVAEADDHRTRIQLAERLQQHVDALVVEELSEVDDGRAIAGEKLGEALGVVLVGQALARIAGIWSVATRFLEQPGERLFARTRAPVVDVHAGRNLVHSIDVADDVLEHLPDVRRADEDGLGVSSSASLPQADSSALPRIEYSSSEPCALTPKRAPVAAPTGPPRST